MPVGIAADCSFVGWYRARVALFHPTKLQAPAMSAGTVLAAPHTRGLSCCAAKDMAKVIVHPPLTLQDMGCPHIACTTLHM
jgi:hypothetical protein